MGGGEEVFTFFDKAECCESSEIWLQKETQESRVVARIPRNSREKVPPASTALWSEYQHKPPPKSLLPLLPPFIDELVEFTLSISARKNPSQRINISSVASTISTAITAPVATRGKSILSVYGAPSPRRRSEKDEKLILIFLAFRRLRNCLHDKTMCRERLLLLRGRQKHINLSLCGFRVPRPRWRRRIPDLLLTLMESSSKRSNRIMLLSIFMSPWCVRLICLIEAQDPRRDWMTRKEDEATFYQD